MERVSFTGIGIDFLESQELRNLGSLPSSYRPGGDRYNEAFAMLWAFRTRLDVSIHIDYTPQFSGRELRFSVDSDAFHDGIALTRLLHTEIERDGIVYRFAGMVAENELEYDYGCEDGRSVGWIEVRFERFEPI